MALTSLPFLSLGGRVRGREIFPLLVATLITVGPSTVTAEDPTPITPSYCRLGGCLWEHHGEGHTNYKGKKKVKKKELVRIACGWGERGKESGIHSLDGHPLLHKDGQQVACYGSGTIYTTAGEHIIAVGDREFTLDFEPVKWYAFDWKNYCWKETPEFDETTGQLLGMWDNRCVRTVVFGRGSWGTVHTIILVRNSDGEWGTYTGPPPE